MALRTLDDLGALTGKVVLLRCDLNVPLKDGVITDDGRVRASIPTVQAILDGGGTVVAMSHLGRPEGSPDPKFSLAPVATRLSELLGEDVAFGTPGESRVTLLENLRFDPRETSKDAGERQAFADELAALGEVVVSDGFGAVHRAHASVYELPQTLPSAAGLLVATELGVLERLTNDPQKPYTVVLGGSKVSDKLGVIDALLPKVDRLLIGGGMLFTFLKAQGYPIGKSLLDRDGLSEARRYLGEAADLGVELVLPTDVVVAESFSADARHVVAGTDAIERTEFGPAGLGLDIGPDTAARFAELIASSTTVFWNGPMGVFELAPFAAGTKTVAEALTKVSGLGVVGGGDSAAAIRQLGFTDDQFGHVSTGGGASLEFIEGKKLPGLEVLGWQQ